MTCPAHGHHSGICHECADERGRKQQHAEWRAAELEAALRLLLDLHDPPSAAIRRRHAERGWNMVLSGAVRFGRVLVPRAPECETCAGKGVHRCDCQDEAACAFACATCNAQGEVPCRDCDGEGCHRNVERVSDVERALWAEIGRKVRRGAHQSAGLHRGGEAMMDADEEFHVRLREAVGKAAHEARRVEIARSALRPGGKGHAPEACPWVTGSTSVVAERCGEWAPGVRCKKCDPLLRDWPDLTEAQRELFRASQDPALSVVMPAAKRRPRCDCPCGAPPKGSCACWCHRLPPYIEFAP